MARFLTNKDYGRQIQTDNLNQVIENDYNTLIYVEQSAQAEMISYLTQRYDVNKVFTDTTSFATSSTYYGNNLVEYTEPLYDQQTTYNPGDRISFEDKIYTNSATMSIIGADPTYTPDWTFIVEDKTLFYAKLPNPEWNNDTNYSVGSQVWYNDITYTAIYDNISVKPTETTYWTPGSTYSFVNFYPENTIYWTKGDNRNQQILMYMIDITLYHLHSRLNPRNIPELRMIRYDGNGPHQGGGAIGWCKRVACGEVNATLPELVPDQGISMQYGSEPKNNNTY